MKVRAKQAKVGEKLFFPDMKLKHGIIPNNFSIELCRVNKIIDWEFSTRNDGDRYEVVRTYGFRTREGAKKDLLKKVINYRKNINKEIKELINKLS